MNPIESKPSKPPAATENVCPEPCCVHLRNIDRLSKGYKQTPDPLAVASSSSEKLDGGSEMRSDSYDDGDECMSEDEIKFCDELDKEMEVYKKDLQERMEKQLKANAEARRRETEIFMASLKEYEVGPSHSEILKKMKATRKELVNLCYKLKMQSRCENSSKC